MDAFLAGDSADEGEERDLFCSLAAVEIFLLEQQFRVSVVSWCFCPQNAQPFFFPDTIRERKRMRVFPQHSRQIRLLQQLNFIRIRHRPPIITALQRASRRIDNNFIIGILHIPFRRQIYQPSEVAFFHFGVDSALVERVEVMNDVHEFCTVEYLFEFALFYVGTDETAHPIVGDDRRWEYF